MTRNRFAEPRSCRSGKAVSRRAVLSGITAGSAAVLAGCGGSERKPEASTVNSAATAAPANRPAEATQPKHGGVFTNPFSDTPALDPIATTALPAQFLAGYVYSRLMKFRTGPDPSVFARYEVEGDLAETLEMAPDGLTATFRLRPTARWQDVAPVSGRAVEAEDIRLALERFRSLPTNANRGVFGTQTDPLIRLCRRQTRARW